METQIHPFYVSHPLDHLIYFIYSFLTSLSRFADDHQIAFPSSLWNSDTDKQYFLKLLVQQIQDSVVFEGPDGSKNLALDSQGMRSLLTGPLKMADIFNQPDTFS